MLERLKEIAHYRRNMKAFNGNFSSLQETPQDQEIVLFQRPRSFTVPHEALFNSPEVKAMMEANKSPKLEFPDNPALVKDIGDKVEK